MAERKFTDQELARRNKLPKYEELGIKPFGQKFVRNATTSSIREKYQEMTEEELTSCTDEVIIAGRSPHEYSFQAEGTLHVLH